MKQGHTIAYVGDELELFKGASNWKRYFARHLHPYISGAVLEVGAGNGINAQYLAAGNASITAWVLVEPDPELALQIDDNTRGLGLPNRQVIQGIIDDVGARQFDTILYIDVLEHIEQAEEEIAKALQRLLPGGHLIVLVPAFNFLYNDFDRRIGHFRRYDKPLLLGQVGGRLAAVKLFYLDSVGFFASLANTLFLKKSLPSPANVRLWDRYLVRLSYLSDVLLRYSFGKSLIGVFRKELSGH
jgi:SAM-dependent methyltransferase